MNHLNSFFRLRHQDAGGIVRRAEAALLAHISSEFDFPRGENSASAILPLLAEHLELDLVKNDPKTWKAVEAVFERAYPWAVSLSSQVHRKIYVLPSANGTEEPRHCDEAIVGAETFIWLVFALPQTNTLS